MDETYSGAGRKITPNKYIHIKDTWLAIQERVDKLDTSFFSDYLFIVLFIGYWKMITCLLLYGKFHAY